MVGIKVKVGAVTLILGITFLTQGSAKDSKPSPPKSQASSTDTSKRFTEDEVIRIMMNLTRGLAQRHAKVVCGKFTGNDRSTAWETPARYETSGETVVFYRETGTTDEVWNGVKSPSGKILLVGHGTFKKDGGDKWNMEFSGDYQKDNTVLKGRYTNYSGASGYRECEIRFLD